MERDVYKEYVAKIEIDITQMGRDETEALKKIEDILQRAQFVDSFDILDILRRL